MKIGVEQLKIVELPDSWINSNSLTEAIWRDFSRENSDIYERLESYIDMKEEYSEIYSQLNKCLEDALDDYKDNNPDFKDRIEEIRDSKNADHIAVDEYYESQIKQDFIRAIKENENCLGDSWQGTLFTEFEEALLNIRENDAVKNYITGLLDFIGGLRGFSGLLNEFRKAKDELMKKYNLYDVSCNSQNVIFL